MPRFQRRMPAMKNTVRIFLTVLLAVAMLFTMTDCSSGSNTAANTATSASAEEARQIE